MSNVIVTIAGSTVTIRESTLNIKKRVDDKDTATFTIVDSTGTLAFSKGQTVSIDDAVLGNLFTGYINKPTATNLYPNATNEWSVDCVNKFYVAAKKSTANTPTKKHRGGKHKNQQSGAIVANQIKEFLAPDGVTGNFGLDWSELQTDWQTGTQSGVVATTNTSTGNEGAGDLELLPAGSTYTSNAESGTVPTVPALMFTGTASALVSNPTASYTIWTGSIAANSNDTFTFTVWISSTSPQISASLDLYYSDGTAYLGLFTFDPEDMSTDPTTDLSGLANDQWYTRTIEGRGTTGKTITHCNLILAGAKSGTYTAYFQNIVYTNNATSTITNIFTNTLNVAIPLTPFGYFNVSLAQVQAAQAPTQKVIFTPSGSPSVAALVQGSQVAWVQTVPSGTNLLLESSVDGQASWQTLTDGSAIPNMLPGTNISVFNLAYRATYTVSSNPAQPTLGFTNFITSITSAPIATKTDLLQAYGNGASGSPIAFSSGTLTNTQVTGNQLLLSGVYRDYALVTPPSGGSNLPLPDQANYISLGIAAIEGKQFVVTCNNAAGTDAKSRLDFAGQWQNFILECDVQVSASGTGFSGLVYRTTGWQTNLDTYAYLINYSSTTLQFGRGTNSSSGAGSFTSISSVTIALTAGSTHRLKAVINGNTHTFFIDGIQLISATDSTYPNAGYVGFRVYQQSSAQNSASFNHVSIRPALSGTWQSAPLSISSPTTYGNSVIAWDIDGIPDGSCTIAMQSSIDGGATFQSVTNGGAIPNLVAGQSLSAKTLILLATLTCTTGPTAPTLNGVSVCVLQQYSSSGARSTAPLMWDSATRVNVASGFGTASNGQTYTQIGTATTALSGNELTIANTTGDAHMHAGSVVSGDTQATGRFSLSASTITAGMELRFTDENNFYRFSASTTTLTLTKVSAGVTVVLATTAMTLSTSTFYRMLFQVIGNELNPITLNGSVWLDGTTQPTAFSITAVD